MLLGRRQRLAMKLAEAGCRDAEIAAIRGQPRRLLAHDTNGVDQERRAVAAIVDMGSGWSIGMPWARVCKTLAAKSHNNAAYRQKQNEKKREKFVAMSVP
jgi:hypothetical protein